MIGLAMMKMLMNRLAMITVKISRPRRGAPGCIDALGEAVGLPALLRTDARPPGRSSGSAPRCPPPAGRTRLLELCAGSGAGGGELTLVERRALGDGIADEQAAGELGRERGRAMPAAMMPGTS